jgi:hypothetical protein
MTTYLALFLRSFVLKSNIFKDLDLFFKATNIFCAFFV